MSLGTPPRVLILGTGAMASLVGARLAEAAAAKVTLAGTWAEAIATVQSRGVTVEDGSTTRVSFPAACRLEEAPASDIVLVLVKSTRTADPEIARAVDRSVEAGAKAVVSLQNGLGNREILEQATGSDRVALGVATFGATLLGPAHVRAFPGEVFLGLQAKAEADAAVRLLTDALSHAGIPAEASFDMDPLIWGKLAVNCAINPLAALTGLTNGALLRSERLRALMGRAAAEVGAVALARGIRLTDEPGARAQAVAEATAENRASMLQDLDRGVPTEIEFLNGAVVREARLSKVEAPVNEWLWRSVRAREATRPGGASLSA
jgi:2-dehydropantoate 2-reductase